ncbi:hypothetical protein PFLA_a0700 [Pseudoalteromonas flavipulchra NCIMB 2033 = ATCC BAA-314]|nr:hypothetical protein [Pseudoalteromonas flavipulchra NCIMB 2033 = ATCC BAA-314]
MDTAWQFVPTFYKAHPFSTPIKLWLLAASLFVELKVRTLG